MIKRTDVLSDIKTDKHLILIPGGPGISSMSIRDLGLLKRSFHLHYVDFPGTNENPYLGKKSFDELSDLLLDEIKKIDGQVFCLGHSYGGLFAADMAIQSACEGIICVATPFSKKTLDEASENYQMKANKALREARRNWDELPNDATFRTWLAAYKELWFCSELREKGRSLLANDLVSSQFFIDNVDGPQGRESFLKAVKSWPKKKLFIAGEGDGLFALEALREDAQQGNFKFISIPSASHFVMVDQPEITAEVIIQFLL